MSTITIQVESRLQWMAVHTPSGVWVAECKPLGITMEGNSLDELHSVIGEACAELLADLFEDNELEEFLRARGWSATNLPDVSAGEDVEFEVPWNLVAEGGVRDSTLRPH